MRSAVCGGAFHVLLVAELLVLEQQVDVVGAEAFQYLVNGLRGLPDPVFTGPQFRGDPHLVVGQPRFGDSCSDAALILVGVGGVDVPVPEPEVQDAGGVVEGDVGLVHNYLQGSWYAQV